MKMESRLLLVLVSLVVLVKGGSWDCTNCNSNVNCINYCANNNSTTTTTPNGGTKTTKRPFWIRTKPKWWIPISCEICFGWARNKNLTIRLHCQYGCAKLTTTTTVPTPTTVVTKTTTVPTITVPTTTRQPTTTSTTTTITIQPIQPTTDDYSSKETLFVSEKVVLQHSSYLWFVVGILGIGIVLTSLFAYRKISLKERQRIGVTDLSVPADNIYTIYTT